uniref:Saposin B-type domain-containing protein n=1 Tax=Panagrellus redivivus TaxID=6233 RepID=A0A7E4VS89_PANRE
MKTAIVLFALVAAIFAAPAVKDDDGDGGKCGLRSIPKLFLKPKPNNYGANFLCEICLDLVQIGEMYAECDEAVVQQKMDDKCDSYLHTGILDRICRDIIDDLTKELEADTEASPSKVCSKVLKSDCEYASS